MGPLGPSPFILWLAINPFLFHTHRTRRLNVVRNPEIDRLGNLLHSRRDVCLTNCALAHKSIVSHGGPAENRTPTECMPYTRAPVITTSPYSVNAVSVGLPTHIEGDHWLLPILPSNRTFSSVLVRCLGPSTCHTSPSPVRPWVPCLARPYLPCTPVFQLGLFKPQHLTAYRLAELPRTQAK